MTGITPAIESPRCPRIGRTRLSAHQYNRLMRAAESRGVKPLDLVGLIVTTVLDDDLIGAVLDD
jgi:hypothetical protein